MSHNDFPADSPADFPFRISVAEAEELINGHMPRYKAEAVPLEDANGRVLAEDVIAERDQPPFDRATMDGIAVAAGTTATTRSLPIEGVQAAGADATALESTEACREIMTGAAMPDGADAVIPVERISIENDSATISATVEEGYCCEAGQFVHRRASDHAKGDVLMRTGTRVRGPEMAALTAAGKAEVSVVRLPSIAVVSTGDELVDVGEPISDTQIRSSNDRAIQASLQQHGFNRVNRSHIADDADALRDSLSALLDNHDVLVLSGGVSMGKFDYIPTVLAELGIEVIFHKITQRPGLPMWFGVSQTGQPVFALPGNPVSTLVCLTRYVIPALHHATGLAANPESVTLDIPLQFEPPLTWFVPVTLSTEAGRTLATPKTTNTSGDFIALANTDGFIELDAAESSFPAGQPARLYRW